MSVNNKSCFHVIEGEFEKIGVRVKVVNIEGRYFSSDPHL